MASYIVYPKYAKKSTVIIVESFTLPEARVVLLAQKYPKRRGISISPFHPLKRHKGLPPFGNPYKTEIIV